jgi:hypothetical protein
VARVPRPAEERALLECSLNDSEVNEILGMSPGMLRHYGKRALVLIIARGASERVTTGYVDPLTIRANTWALLRFECKRQTKHALRSKV